MNAIELFKLRRKSRQLAALYLRFVDAGKPLRAFVVGCQYNNVAHRFNTTRPRFVRPMGLINLEVQ